MLFYSHNQFIQNIAYLEKVLNKRRSVKFTYC